MARLTFCVWCVCTFNRQFKIPIIFTQHCTENMKRLIFTLPAKIPQTPMMQRTLKTAEPTMVPTPTSPLVMNTPTDERLQHSKSHEAPPVLLILRKEACE